MRNQMNLITIVGILLIIGGIVRIVVALASGNPEHMALGTIVGIAYGAIAGIALWVDRHFPDTARCDPGNVRGGT